MSQNVSTMIPMQVLAEIDNSRNPMQLTRDRLERAATENQFMNGKIQAIKVRFSITLSSRVRRSPRGLRLQLSWSTHLPSFASLTIPLQSYREYYNEALMQSFPDLKDYLSESSDTNIQVPPVPGSSAHLNGTANGNGIHG